MDTHAIGSAKTRMCGRHATTLPPRTAPRWFPLSIWERLITILRFFAHFLMRMPASSWLVTDVAILCGLLHISFTLFPPPEPLQTPHVVYWQACAVFAFGLLMSSLVLGLYDRDTITSRSRILTRVLLTVPVAIMISYAVIYVVMYMTVGRKVTGVTMTSFVILATSLRLYACWVAQQQKHGLLVVGTRALFESFVREQKKGMLHEYYLAGYLTSDDQPPPHDPHCLGTVRNVVNRLQELNISQVVVSAEASLDKNVMNWVVPCLQRGCRVTNEAIFYEKATGQILVDEITAAWFLFADLKMHCEELAVVKRIFDLVAAVLGLLLSAPLWPLIALAVKLCDRGSVFYSQDRVGQHGQIFKLYKFRTMRPDAEKGKSVWASVDDPRITAVGRFLRKSRLDELPQLYNILIGQMSVIGPRPERPDIVKSLCDQLPYYAERHLVKPGLTGWAQISYGYGSTVQDAKRKLQFDLFYLKHMSFELDMMILFRTGGTFMRGGL